MNQQIFDVGVIGSGIAGISIASELSQNFSVCVLEKEKLLSYHSTGRSMAFYIESYGNVHASNTSLVSLVCGKCSTIVLFLN